MYNLLRVIAPPLGLGKKCPHRVAYKVCNFRDSLQHSQFWFRFYFFIIFLTPQVQMQMVQNRNRNVTAPLPDQGMIDGLPPRSSKHLAHPCPRPLPHPPGWGQAAL